MTNKKSFTNLQQWLTEVNEFASADVPKLLIGKLSQLINYCTFVVMDSEKVEGPQWVRRVQKRNFGSWILDFVVLFSEFFGL